MKRKGTGFQYLDSLYGHASLPEEISALAGTAAVQRLRDIRQSNIDSLGLPAFANSSRYEHALGTWNLAQELALVLKLNKRDTLALEAAAILHDTAISPFGHLIEEGYEYLGKESDHEKRWARLLSGDEKGAAIGGIRTQLYLGRQAGIDKWAEAIGLGPSRAILDEIFHIIKGEGLLGPAIKGELDLDNLDNVVRAAYQCGITTDRGLPKRIVHGIRGIKSGQLVFGDGVIPDINLWLDIRSKLYDRLMFSEVDFIGKAMMLSAVITCLESGALKDIDWVLTDRELINHLLAGNQDSQRAASDWLLGVMWPFSGIVSMRGPAPSYPEVLTFSKSVSDVLGRKCFGYRIKDKRVRRVEISMERDVPLVLGSKSNQWFIGLVSQKQKEFTIADKLKIIQMLSKAFTGSEVIPDEVALTSDDSPNLFNDDK